MTLRGKIATAIELGYLAYDERDDEELDYYPFFDMSDAAIAAFREALLSDDAVTAMLEAIEADSMAPMAMTANRYAGRKVVSEGAMVFGRMWLTAALAAVTEGGGGDGR